MKLLIYKSLTVRAEVYEFYSFLYFILRLLIASEAGCVYSNLDGKPFNYNNKGIVVANSSENLSLILIEYKNI